MNSKLILTTALASLLPGCGGALKKEADSPAPVEKQAIANLQKNTADARAAMYSSLDFGQTWLPIQSGLPAETQAAFMEKRGGRIILATDNLGIFESSEDKQSWRQIGGGLPGVKITALHLSGGETHAGVWEKGIFASKDGGKTWLPLNGNLKDLRVRAILKMNGELIVATDSGIFKSTGGQKNWKQVFAGCQVVSLNMEGGKAAAGGVLGVLLSLDGGERWEWIHREGAAHNTAIIEGRIFLMNMSGDLFSSEDWGKNWQLLEYAPREKSYVYDIEKVGNWLVMSNNYGIHRSSDWGKTWELAHPTEEVVFFDFAVFGNVAYSGTRSWNEYRKRR